MQILLIPILAVIICGGAAAVADLVVGETGSLGLGLTAAVIVLLALEGIADKRSSRETKRPTVAQIRRRKRQSGN